MRAPFRIRGNHHKIGMGQPNHPGHCGPGIIQAGEGNVIGVGLGDQHAAVALLLQPDLGHRIHDSAGAFVLFHLKINCEVGIRNDNKARLVAFTGRLNLLAIGFSEALPGLPGFLGRKRSQRLAEDAQRQGSCAGFQSEGHGISFQWNRGCLVECPAAKAIGQGGGSMQLLSRGAVQS